MTLSVSILNADIVQHVVSAPPTEVSSSGETALAVAVPQFDANLGTLTAVHISVQSTMNYDSSVMNLNGPTPLTAIYSVAANLRRPDSSVILSGTPTDEVNAFINMFENLFFAGSADDTQAGTLADAGDLALFTGGGSVPLTLGGTGSVNLAPPFGLFAFATFWLAAEVTVSYEYSVAPSDVEVAFDVKPGSSDNSVNLKSNGVLPTAILTTAEFDAATVDVSSLQLGDPNLSGVAGAVHSGLQDVDADGDLDLVVHFRTADLVAAGAVNNASTQLLLTGADLAGTALSGVDSIRIVPGSSKGK